MDKAMEIGGPIIEKLLNIVTMLIPLFFVAATGYYGYIWALKFYVEAKANEWMIIIRNGEMIKRGIGLCTWVMPTD